MRTFTKREKIIAGICLLFFLAFLGKQLIFMRLTDYNSGLESRMDLAIRKISQAKSILQKESFYDAQFAELQKFVGVAASEGAEMARMASKTEEVARQVGVRVVNVQPLAVRKKKFYISYPLEVVLEGEWKGIARFVHLMQVFEHSLDIEQMRLEKNSERAASLRGRVVLNWIRLMPLAR